MNKYYFTNQTIDRAKAREIELKVESMTDLVLENPFYDGDAKEVRQLDGTGKTGLTHDEIVGADLRKIRESKGIVAYMSSDRNIGSVMEIAIASFSWGKPVYIICEPSMVHIKNHPWIKYFGISVFDSVYEFIKYAKEHLQVHENI